MVFRLSQVRLLTVSLIFHSNQGKRQNFFSRGDYRKNTVPVSMIKKAGSYSHYRPGKKNAHNQVTPEFCSVTLPGEIQLTGQYHDHDLWFPITKEGLKECVY
jgi:hypothetical protein